MLKKIPLFILSPGYRVLEKAGVSKNDEINVF
jgi:hypothetical protein